MVRGPKAKATKAAPKPKKEPARPAKAAAPAKPAAPAKAAAARAAKKAAPVAPGAKKAAAGKVTPPAARPAKKPALRPTAAPVPARPAAEASEKVAAMQRERSELQDMIRQLRADFDSTRAEAERLRDRVRELESEPARSAERSQQPAGPGEFDPAVDLDDDLPSMAEDELDGAAGFFDRMDEIRARRNELDRERNDRELEQTDQPFWMICPKCGDLMEEQESENIKLERCDNCGGLYLDRGEVDLLISICTGPEGQRRLHNTLKF